MPAAESGQTVAHLIEAVGLTGFEKVLSRHALRRMQQRVAIARTLAIRPQSS